MRGLSRTSDFAGNTHDMASAQEKKELKESIKGIDNRSKQTASDIASLSGDVKSLVDAIKGLTVTTKGHRARQNESMTKQTDAVRKIQEDNVKRDDYARDNRKVIREMQGDVTIIRRRNTRAIWGPKDIKKKLRDEEDPKERAKKMHKWMQDNMGLSKDDLPNPKKLRVIVGKGDEGPIQIGTISDDTFYQITDLDRHGAKINKNLREKGGTVKKKIDGEEREFPNWSYGDNVGKKMRDNLKEARKEVKYEEIKEREEAFEDIEREDLLSLHDESELSGEGETFVEEGDEDEPTKKKAKKSAKKVEESDEDMEKE